MGDDTRSRGGGNCGTGQQQPQQVNPLAMGMAIGSGLRTMASTQRLMGFKKSAESTERAASNAQLAGMGVSIAQAAAKNPAVQRTLERGQRAIQDNPKLQEGLISGLKMAGGLLLSAQKTAGQQQNQSNDGR